MRKEIPILMQTEMVQGVTANIKNMTRRLRGLELVNECPDEWTPERWDNTNPLWNIEVTGKEYVDFAFFKGDKDEVFYAKCPYGKKGDVLWVREMFNYRFEDKNQPAYRAEIDEKTSAIIKWKPSIHMPKAACRIWLEVVDVKVERLHDITTEDIKVEGVRIPVSDEGNVMFQISETHCALNFLPQDGKEWTNDEMFFAHWAELWCQINGRANWDLNPWVWVIKFKRIVKPANSAPVALKGANALI